MAELGALVYVSLPSCTSSYQTRRSSSHLWHGKNHMLEWIITFYRLIKQLLQWVLRFELGWEHWPYVIMAFQVQVWSWCHTMIRWIWCQFSTLLIEVFPRYFSLPLSPKTNIIFIWCEGLKYAQILLLLFGFVSCCIFLFNNLLHVSYWRYQVHHVMWWTSFLILLTSCGYQRTPQ